MLYSFSDFCAAIVADRQLECCRRSDTSDTSEWGESTLDVSDSLKTLNELWNNYQFRYKKTYKTIETFGGFCESVLVDEEIQIYHHKMWDKYNHDKDMSIKQQFNDWKSFDKFRISLHE